MSSETTRFFRFFNRAPITRDAGDPEYAGILLLFAFTVTVALLAFGGTGNAYSHVLQTAGGALVLLGLYFTGINLRWARSEQYAGRLTNAIAQLGSESEAVRVGTIRLLEAMLLETPHVPRETRVASELYRSAVVDALNALSGESESLSGQLAREVSARLANEAQARLRGTKLS